MTEYDLIQIRERFDRLVELSESLLSTSMTRYARENIEVALDEMMGVVSRDMERLCEEVRRHQPA